MAIYAIQPVFGKGELSPKLRSRIDQEAFKTGLAECQNWMVMRQGGIRRRPGTQYIDAVKDSTRPARLIPFIFNTAQTYFLLFNAGVIRVYAQGGRVGTFEVAHSYADGDLFGLDFDQTNDVLDITHKSYAPMRITRQSDTAWTLAATLFRFGPYLPVNSSSTSITPSGTGNPIPIMTSNTAPSGVCNASTQLTPAWNGFDADASTVWNASTKAGEWLSYTFTSTRIMTGYSVTAGSGVIGGDLYTARAPKAWTFEGFDGTAWVVLDSQFGQNNWSDNEIRFFRFTNSTAYIGYRINCSSNNGGGVIGIAEMAFTEDMSTASPITLTASSITGINNGAGFSAADVGRIIAILGSNAIYRAFVITGYTSPTVVSAKLDDAPLPIAQATLEWRLGAWGVTPGWPAHVCTFEGRKIYARTNLQPSGVWGTRSGGYGTFLDFSTNIPIQDDDAITFTLTDVNEIQWIAEGPDLLIGTAGAARTMGRDSPNLPFSANNFRQLLASTYASQAIRPTKVGSSTVFCSTFGKGLREFVPSQTGVGYDTPDISIISDHMLATGIVELCYQQEPDSVIWLPNGKGEAIGFTYEKSQAMAGMHRHDLGGNGFVEACSSIPGVDRNEVWMVVRRTINGASARYVERLSAPYEASYMPITNSWYVDCGLQYNGSPVTSVTGLSHLEGQTVQILADGAREADAVVTSGSVSLASGRAASIITVGLQIVSRAKLLKSNVAQGDGSGLGRRKKVVGLLLDILEAGSCKVGHNSATAEENVTRSMIDELGLAVPLFTGIRPARFESSWSDQGEVYLIADGPLPCTIRSVTPMIEPEP